MFNHNKFNNLHASCKDHKMNTNSNKSNSRLQHISVLLNPYSTFEWRYAYMFHTSVISPLVLCGFLYGPKQIQSVPAKSDCMKYGCPAMRHDCFLLFKWMWQFAFSCCKSTLLFFKCGHFRRSHALNFDNVVTYESNLIVLSLDIKAFLVPKRNDHPSISRWGLFLNEFSWRHSIDLLLLSGELRSHLLGLSCLGNCYPYFETPERSCEATTLVFSMASANILRTHFCTYLW